MNIFKEEFHSTILDLSNNKISYLSLKTFKGLTKLNILSLANNDISGMLYDSNFKQLF